MRNIFIIIKKELKRFFTDKRMLTSLFLPGIILYIVYSLMGNVMGGMMSADKDYVYKVAINVESEAVTELVFDYIKTNSDLTFEKVVLDTEKAEAKFENEEIDLFINYQKGVDGQLDSYEVQYNSTSAESTAIYSEFISILSAMSAKPIYNVIPLDVATEEDTTAMLINLILPFLLITLLFSGCMAVATESIAGEKERGTIATLLITPVKRSYIALGKVLALSVTALASASVSFVSVILSLPKLMAGSGDSMNIKLTYGVTEYACIFAVIVVTVLLFTVILSLVSTFAKSIKEATSYAMPVMILVMVLGLTSMLGQVGDSISSYLIPVYNSMRCMSMIFAFDINPMYLIVTVLSNIAYIALGIFALAKLFSSERVMFNK